MRRVALAAVAAITGLVALPPAAQANHVAPTVSASLTLGKAVRHCSATERFCARARRATVAWNASCGPAAPADSLEEIDVTIYGVRPDGKRYAYDGETLDYEGPLTGSLGMTAGPGLRFLAEVVVTCAATTVDAEGNEVTHRARATASTTQYYLRPQVVAARTARSGFCGVTPPRSKIDRWLQAGQFAELAWFLAYSAPAMVKPGRSELRQIKLFARGAGIRLKRSPDRGMLREYGYVGTWLTPRRGGTLKIWARIGGHRTNTLRVRVLPKRC